MTHSDLPVLADRRRSAVRAWSRFIEHGDDVADQVRSDIMASWRLSCSVRTDVAEAPLDDEQETAAFFDGSPLQNAVTAVEAELRRTAEDGDLVLAVTDEQTRILWTYGGRTMRRKAETVNFVPGSRWDERSVGTNALAMASRLDSPTMVFSAEHYAPMVHNWVCWAAPIHDPLSGRVLGVVDLSTTWERTHPIGLATARVLARLLESAMPHSRAHPSRGVVPTGLNLRVLGRLEITLDGQRVLVNRRQSEILVLLALHPEGLSLERLHAMVYGDQPVTVSTLKAEVSHLRSALGGQLASRPYRLLMPVTSDVEDVQSLLRAGQVGAALDTYAGDLLPGTTSPALEEHGEYLAVAIREAVLADPTPDTVLRFAELAPYDVEVLQRGLDRWADSGHPAVPLLKGRLAASRRD